MFHRLKIIRRKYSLNKHYIKHHILHQQNKYLITNHFQNQNNMEPNLGRQDLKLIQRRLKLRIKFNINKEKCYDLINMVDIYQFIIF